MKESLIINKFQKMYGKNVFIKLHEPDLSFKDFGEVKKSIKNNYVSTIGNVVKKFEKKLSTITKSNFVVATVSGSAALHTSVCALNIKKNEEILMPTLNYIASANAALLCNAIPHFIDVERNTLGVDPVKLEKYLKKNTIIRNKICYNKKTKRKIKAIIVLHAFGHPSKIDLIKKISKKYHLYLIEDAAEALGSKYKKKHLGTFGDIGILSFNGNKIITCGGGGAIITNNKLISKKALHLISNSKLNHRWKYDYDQLGFNYRMPGINAALGVSQLMRLKKFIKSKRKIYKKYNELFSSVKNVELFKEPKNSYSNYWLNTLLVDSKNIKQRDNLIKKLNLNGIAVRPVWTLLHKISYLKKFPKMNLDNAIKLEKQIISLPSSSQLLNRMYV